MVEVNGTDVTRIPIPGLKCYRVTASDLDTFTPKGFSEISSVQISYERDPGTGPAYGYTLNGRVITIHHSGVTNGVYSIWVQGRQ